MNKIDKVKDFFYHWRYKPNGFLLIRGQDEELYTLYEEDGIIVQAHVCGALFISGVTPEEFEDIKEYIRNPYPIEVEQIKPSLPQIDEEDDEEVDLSEYESDDDDSFDDDEEDSSTAVKDILFLHPDAEFLKTLLDFSQAKCILDEDEAKDWFTVWEFPAGTLYEFTHCAGDTGDWEFFSEDEDKLFTKISDENDYVAEKSLSKEQQDKYAAFVNDFAVFKVTVNEIKENNRSDLPVVMKRLGGKFSDYRWFSSDAD